MPYYALEASGERLGPADPEQLKAWAAEGRITEQTIIENSDTGEQVPAFVLPALFPHRDEVIPNIGQRQSAPKPISSAPIRKVRRRQPISAFFRALFGVYALYSFVQRLIVGHYVFKHDAHHHSVLMLWLDKYPVLMLLVGGYALYWAWEGWSGKE